MKSLPKYSLFLATLLLLFLLAFPVQAEEKGVIYQDTSGTNSWWVYPLSVNYTGKYNKTYTSYTTNEGYSGLIEKDNDTGNIRRVNIDKLSIDDHNAGAVEVLEDGRILYVTSDHCKRHYLNIFISRKPEDISSWKKPIKLKANGRVTYAQIIKASEGYYLFTRLLYSDSETPADEGIRWTWAVSFSKNGKKWSALKNIINGTTKQYYLKAMACTDSNCIRLVMYSNPNAKATDFRLAFFNPSNNTIEDESGNKLYSITKNGTGVLYQDVPILVSKGNQNQRLLDVAYTPKDTTAIAYATFQSSKTAQYRYTVYSSGTQTKQKITKSGSAFYTRSKYFGGIAISENSYKTIYLSRKKGKYWYIEKWKLTKNGFKKIKTIRKTSSQTAIRPFLTKYCKGSLNWSEGFYSKTSYKNFNMKIKTKQQ